VTKLSVQQWHEVLMANIAPARPVFLVVMRLDRSYALPEVAMVVSLPLLATSQGDPTAAISNVSRWLCPHHAGDLAPWKNSPAISQLKN